VISGEDWENMFQGQVLVRVGAFYRIAFPRDYRELLGNKIIVTYGFENSLIATSESQWEKIFTKEFDNKSVLSTDVRDLRRVFLGGITTVEFDQQGRFVIPEYLREYAKIQIQTDAVFVWQKDYVEIWDKLIWEDRQKEVLKNISLIAEKLSREEIND
jgi:MraZ protein